MRTKHLAEMASSLSIAVACLATAPVAWAQAAAAPAPASSSTSEKPAGKDEIVVTAERKTQNLQKYAGTATIVTGQVMKEQGIQNITDLEGHIPGLQILANNNNIEVYIRGGGRVGGVGVADVG